MTVPLHRAAHGGRWRPQPRWRGRPEPRGLGWLAGHGRHLAGFAKGIRARYAVSRGRAERTSRVLLGRSLAQVSQFSHHEHVHVHPVLPRHTVTRQTWSAPHQRAAPEARRRGQAPVTETGRGKLVPDRPRLVTGSSRSAPITAPLSTRAVRRSAAGLPVSIRGPGMRVALIPAAHFTARTAPAQPVRAVSRRLAPAPETQTPARPAEPAGDVPGHEVTARPAGAPSDHPVVTGSPGGRPTVPLDLDFVASEVLRRIERRAIAQRERLGRGAF